MKNISVFWYILLMLAARPAYCQPSCQTTSISPQGYITLTTPVGSWVSAIFYNDLTQTEKNCFNNYVSTHYSGVTILNDATSTYNCYSYAWNLYQGGSTVCWMNGGTGGSITNNISAYWTDGSYTQVSWEPDFAGGVVLYGSGGDHAAVTTGTSGVYQSKWSGWSLTQHAWNNVPLAYLTPPYDNRLYYVRSYCACSGAPDMSSLTYDGSNSVNTVTFVSANNWHTINTFPACYLASSFSWNPGSTVNWYSSGLRNETGHLYLTSGQSVTFFTSATNHCGTSTRNPTFAAQSYYRMSSNSTDGTVRNILDIEFDNTDYLEILPQEIVIYDQTSTKEELRIDIKSVFAKKQFVGAGKTLRIDVNKLTNGVKIINLLYPKVDGKSSEQILNSKDYDRKAERFIINN